MAQIGRVVCPVDFTDFSRRSLHYAVALARWYGAPLIVLYVHYVPEPAAAMFAGLGAGPAEGRVLSQADRNQLRQEMEALLLPAGASNVAVQYTIAEGEVAGEILGLTEASDLIVMGTHGRSGFEHLVIGSVTEKVLRKTPCALLTIPQSGPDATAAVPGLFHHILAAVDFALPSRRALDYALSLAEEADAHLTVLHVIEVPRYLARWVADAEDGHRYVAQWKANARKDLGPLVPDAARIYAHVDERVEAGVPYREILRVAAEQHSGLIVIGAHGAGAAEPRFVGSTTQHVVRQAPCPVLTIRAM